MTSGNERLQKQFKYRFEWLSTNRCCRASDKHQTESTFLRDKRVIHQNYERVR